MAAGELSRRGRVLAALRGAPVDRVPVSFWGHHYVAENTAAGLAEETLRQARLFEWDYLKPQSRAQSFAEMWGLTYTPAPTPNERYTVTRFPVHAPEDFATLQPADPTTGALGEQLEALRLIRAAIGPDVPIIWTVFSPLMVARYLLPDGAAQLLALVRSTPAALERGLEAITETLVGYARACLASGADGLFYATNLATRALLTPEECRRFQRPFDLPVLEAARQAPFNVLHVCGQDALFDELLDYPVAAFSWALGPGNPTLAELQQRTGRTAMGGLPTGPELKALTPEQAAARTRAAIQEMGGRWLLLAPGCSIDRATPPAVLHAVRAAAAPG